MFNLINSMTHVDVFVISTETLFPKGLNPAQSTFVLVMRKSAIFLLIFILFEYLLFFFIEPLEPYYQVIFSLI